MEEDSNDKMYSLDALLPGGVGLQGAAAGSGSSQKSVSVATDYMQMNRKMDYIGDLDWDWQLTVDHVDEWERICRRCMLNVFMSYDEVSRWLWRLPNLLAMKGNTKPTFFPRGNFRNYEYFLNSVERLLLVSRSRTEENVEKLDVPLHVYRRRKEVVSVIEEVQKEEAIDQNKMNKWYTEWTAFYDRISKREAIDDNDEKKWLKRCAVIEFLKDDDYEEFQEGCGLTDFYICISSGLRELRRYKEDAQIEEGRDKHQYEGEGGSSTITDEGNDILQMNKEGNKDWSFKFGEGTSGQSHRSPILDFLPCAEFHHPSPSRNTKAGKRNINYEEDNHTNDEAMVDAGLEDIKKRINDAIEEAELMNNIQGSHLMEIMDEVSMSIQAVINMRCTTQLRRKKNSKFDAQAPRALAVTSGQLNAAGTKPVMVDASTDMELTPCWWESKEERDKEDQVAKMSVAKNSDQRQSLWSQVARNCTDPDPMISCWRCGNQGHKKKDCDARSKLCVACDRLGMTRKAHRPGSRSCAARAMARKSDGS